MPAVIGMPHAAYSLYPRTSLNTVSSYHHSTQGPVLVPTMAAPAPGVPFNSNRRPSPSLTSPSKTSRQSFDLGPRDYPPSSSASTKSALSVALDGAGNEPTLQHDAAAYRPSIRSPASNSSLHQQYTASRIRDSSSVSRLSRQPSFDDFSKGPGTEETAPTSMNSWPALQTRGLPSTFEHLAPVAEDDPASYDLVAPATQADKDVPLYSLEQRSDDMFSAAHLEAIFRNPAALLSFTSFLAAHRQESVPLLIYYLDALKALRAVGYANSVAAMLRPLDGHPFSEDSPDTVCCESLRQRTDKAFDALLNHDLPAYISHIFVNVVSASIQRRITGTLPAHLQEASDGLAEVFCLTDPSRRDNPIVFASEEFHRTTQYGVSHAIGRNCRFLQGPRTNPYSIERLAAAVKAGRDHTETFLNYRRDGSPFLNLLMVAPLRDSRGNLRYYIGAQVDVSGLAKECTGLDALQALLLDEDRDSDKGDKDEFQSLVETFNPTELDVVKQFGGRMHRQQVEETEPHWNQPRLLLKGDSLTPPDEKTFDHPGKTIHGRLVGVYSHYLLIRPYPSLRILFTSPSLRVPGILQSRFMDRIGSSERVCEELLAAFAACRGVTAKIRWLTNANDEYGRSRWLHCTPLLGANGSVGVWMIVLVDEPGSVPKTKFREAPPVPTTLPKTKDVDGLHRQPLDKKFAAPADSGEPYPFMGRPSVVAR